jgi:MFS family permease
MSTLSTPRLIPTRLWNIDFTLLWQGQLVSQLGTQAAFVGTMLWTLQATGSPAVMALLLIVSSVPAVVLGPVAGAVVDRQSRKALIVGSDIVRGVAALAVTTALLYRPSSTDLIVMLLLSSAVVSGLAGALFGPAVRAMLPDIVPAERLAAANALSTMGSQAASLVGLAAGGALYAAVGPAMLFLADGVSYLFSAATELFIRFPPQSAGERGGTLRIVLSQYRRDTAEGLRYCLADPGRRGFITIAAGLNFLFMPIFVLLPLFVEGVLGASASWYGFLLAGMSGGSLVGLLFAGRRGDDGRRRGTTLTAALLGTGALMAALGFVRHVAVALTIVAAIGAMTAMVNVLVMTLMQIRTPAHMRGRALAVLIAVSGAAAPLGLALGGLLGEALGNRIPEVYVVFGGAAVLLSGVLLSRPTVRGFLGGDPDDSPVP